MGWLIYKQIRKQNTKYQFCSLGLGIYCITNTQTYIICINTHKHQMFITSSTTFFSFNCGTKCCNFNRHKWFKCPIQTQKTKPVDEPTQFSQHSNKYCLLAFPSLPCGTFLITITYMYTSYVHTHTHTPSTFILAYIYTHACTHTPSAFILAYTCMHTHRNQTNR